MSIHQNDPSYEELMADARDGIEAAQARYNDELRDDPLDAVEQMAFIDELERYYSDELPDDTANIPADEFERQWRSLLHAGRIIPVLAFFIPFLLLAALFVAGLLVG